MDWCHGRDGCISAYQEPITFFPPHMRSLAPIHTVIRARATTHVHTYTNPHLLCGSTASFVKQIGSVGLFPQLGSCQTRATTPVLLHT